MQRVDTALLCLPPVYIHQQRDIAVREDVRTQTDRDNAWSSSRVGHLGAMDGVGDTVANLEAAIGGETYEYEDMYPPMLEDAIAEGHKAKRMFGFAVEAEQVHAKLYSLALEAAKKGEDLTETTFHLCPVCGHIEFGEPPERCPICNVPAAKFVTV